MKNIKRLLSVFLLLTSILSLLAGCTDKNENVNETTDEITTVAEITYPELIIETTNDENRIYEKMANYEFIPDNDVLGQWMIVDYVQNINDFDPNVTNDSDTIKNVWQIIEFFNDGTIYENNGLYLKWTKGYLLDIADIVPAYTVKQINGTDYMFLEWKRWENYLRNGEKPWYFVFKKGNIEYYEYYYPNHRTYPNEHYRTLLADISKVGKGEPVIALRESPGDMSWRVFDESLLSSKKDDIWGYDMRSCDVSQMDLSVIKSYNDISFDSSTKFPDIPDKLPVGFNAENILEFNKNPGLGIQKLHEQGITGKGVNIAIIDQNLLVEHEQYKDNLMYYERIHSSGYSADMHGAAVSSIAVGKDIGVAPDAKFYYIAETHGHFLENGDFEFDASIIADCILRILDINKNLPENEKIRVISISRGYTQSDKGYKEITEAIKQADSENVFVITTSTSDYYKNFNLFGLDRDYLANPDDFNSFEPASWIQQELYSQGSNQRNESLILFPMGSRTYASFTGEQNYEIGHSGGLSWAVPWCAGFYALCCQVKPDITPQEFIDVVNSTSILAQTVHNGKTYNFGKIVNPAEVIETLQGKY